MDTLVQLYWECPIEIDGLDAIPSEKIGATLKASYVSGFGLLQSRIVGKKNPVHKKTVLGCDPVKPQVSGGKIPPLRSIII